MTERTGALERREGTRIWIEEFQRVRDFETKEPDWLAAVIDVAGQETADSWTPITLHVTCPMKTPADTIALAEQWCSFVGIRALMGSAGEVGPLDEAIAVAETVTRLQRSLYDATIVELTEAGKEEAGVTIFHRHGHWFDNAVRGNGWRVDTFQPTLTNLFSAFVIRDGDTTGPSFDNAIRYKAEAQAVRWAEEHIGPQIVGGADQYRRESGEMPEGAGGEGHTHTEPGISNGKGWHVETDIDANTRAHVASVVITETGEEVHQVRTSSDDDAMAMAVEWANAHFSDVPAKELIATT